MPDYDMPNGLDNREKVLHRFYEEYQKAKAANHAETFTQAINVIQQLQKIGGAGNEKETFGETLGVEMTPQEAAKGYQDLLTDSKSHVRS
jgi:hypothetical protein